MLINTFAWAEEPVYRFGVNESLPPFSYPTTSGQDGLAIDMAKEVFETAGIRAEIVPMNWAEAQTQLKIGELDGLIHVTPTQERREWLNFTGSFLKNDYHFFTRENFDFAYQKPSDLRGYTVATEDNGYIYNLLKSQAGIKLLPFALQRDAIKAVAHGKADVYIGDVIVAEYLVREHQVPSLVYHPEPFSEAPSRIGVSPEHADLLPVLNDALRQMRSSGRFQQIQAKWDQRTVDFLGKQQATQRYLLAAGATGLLFFIAFFRERKQKLRAIAATQQRDAALAEKSEALSQKSAALAEKSDALEALESSLKQITKAKEDKDKFIAQVTHEFRTPLNTIYGTIRLLRPNDEETREAAAKIKQSSRQLVSMSNNILLWEKSEMGKLKPLEQIYSLRLMLDQIESTCAYKARATKNEWKYQIAEQIPDLLVTDWHFVRKCLENVLDNAFKHCRDGSVSLSLEMSENAIDFIIKDNGVGMNPQKLLQVCEGYYAPEGYENNRTTQGVGLGLAVANSIAKALNGALEITSQEGLGTVVVISLPLRQADEDEVLAFEKAQTMLSKEGDEVLTGYRLLVVDDHPLNLQINSHIFEHLGATVFTATGSLEAEQIVRKQFESNAPFDVIFMDLQMPEIDGFEAIRRIREQNPEKHLNFVALTACDHDTLYEELAGINVIDVLHKPFEPNDAVRIVLQSGARSLSLTKRILANISTGTQF